MKKTFLFFLVFTFYCQSYSQNYIEAGSFKFKFIKAKKAVGGTYVYSIKTPKEEKKIQVRFKMKSLSGNKEDFDPNKFYLVSKSYKWRVRPVDVRHNYAAGWIFIGFDYLIDFKSNDKEVKKWASYKPDIKNTFNDYKIEGYKDISNSISFGGTKESLLGPRSKVVILNPYLDHKQLKSCKIDLYFSLPKDMKEFEIYYGNKLLVNTKIK